MKLDVLAIGAHPDDIELSCGGTIVKLKKQGKRVGIADLTEGELGTRGSRELRAQEANTAARILGVDVRLNLHMTDGHIDLSQENRLKIIELIRTVQPEILLFPHWLERHPDHEHAHRLCREAWFYSGLEKIVTTVDGKSQEPFRPRSYYHYMQTYEFVPSFIIDISEEYEQRKQSVAAYESQFHNPASLDRETFLSSPEFLKMMEARFEYYGDRIGRKYGEPFFSVNMIGITDIFHLTL
ncbi:MAG: bacillithiol biosynthesis deacetylase BshB1 [Ignavibacteria bacterium]|nr:bacillithiol biosynthesis deacetylase BshB1 [Ignavibacteria bacterium]